jgi:2-polyprenyl-3-methyl-5-hydroxy-6-metoxy-1,4-benzoquinol methylase
MDNNSNQYLGNEASKCILCGDNGSLIYDNCTDVLFGVSGQWSFKKCRNARCGLLWLNPRPRPEAIADFYKNYYTKIEQSDFQLSSGKKIIKNLYQLFIACLGIYNKRKRLDMCYLDRVKPGRLLEIGCGNGSRLNLLKKTGWQVEGQEIDPVSARIAYDKFGVKIYSGSIFDIQLIDNHYDAIILCNVIEHVLNPIEVLNKCRNLLKSGGAIFITTPNAGSIGLKLFKKNWRGLEPPRHIAVYTRHSLKALMTNSGFVAVDIITTSVNAESYYNGSKLISNGIKFTNCIHNSFLNRLKAISFQMISMLIVFFFRSKGEECVVFAIKP